MQINEQLFTGYLSAIGSFAQETFKDGLHSIQIKNGQKLVFYLESKHNLVFSVLSHEKDNDFILQKLLSRIANTFILRFHELLISKDRTLIDPYREFDKKG